MDRQTELTKEQQYTAHVQQLLLAVVERSRDYSQGHLGSIRALLADAWEELRLKPTALSVQDMEQLSAEVDRFLARKTLTDNLAKRYEAMLMNPFFARVDFQEDGAKEKEKIVIGLYSLKDTDGEILVHDWRAPVCSLYYDAMPGTVSYESPSGEIRGQMTLKRQYKMENGRLKYYVDTDVGIDDEMLLDILSGATSRHIRQIVSTIQEEQNRAIRYANVRLLSVIGGAGSGKTSVAMHRAAFLMYRHRDHLDAKRIAILSPSNSFSEYISTVLPELGEENAAAVTLNKITSEILGQKVEIPLLQTEALLDESNVLRRESVRYKSGEAFLNRMRGFVAEFARMGPAFEDVALSGNTLVTGAELTRMYRTDYKLLSPALRITRIQTVLDSRLEQWEKSLYAQYEKQLISSYRGKDLEMATRFAVSHRLQPVRQQIRRQTRIQGRFRIRTPAQNSLPAHLPPEAMPTHRHPRPPLRHPPLPQTAPTDGTNPQERQQADAHCRNRFQRDARERGGGNCGPPLTTARMSARRKAGKASLYRWLYGIPPWSIPRRRLRPSTTRPLRTTQTGVFSRMRSTSPRSGRSGHAEASSARCCQSTPPPPASSNESGRAARSAR